MHPTSQYKSSTPEIRRIYDGFENNDYVAEKGKIRREMHVRGREDEELEECVNTTTLLQRLLMMSLHYAPEFFKTITTQNRDDLRAQHYPEEQVRERETILQLQQLLELYGVLPARALEMWITCGKIPSSYLQETNDGRHKYYNFHREVHYAITDFINLYLYNFPTEYARTATQFTTQDYYFVVVHTTEGLLKELGDDIELETQRTDVAGWYSRKGYDYQCQIENG
eukprot:40683-Amphidinium_carterae.1